MAKPNAQTTEKSEPKTASPQLWALNPMVSMVGLSGWSEIVNESVQFLSERIEMDMQAQRDLLKCKSLGDVMDVQSRYYQTSVEQYAKQVQRAVELISRTTALGWSEAATPRARNYDDVPL